MAPKKNSKKAAHKEDQSALVDLGFFYQLQQGGAQGWDDRYARSEDLENGIERIYLKYYDASVACAEVVEIDQQKMTKLTVFAEPAHSPVESDKDIPQKEWTKFQTETMEALKHLRLPFRPEVADN